MRYLAYYYSSRRWLGRPRMGSYFKRHRSGQVCPANIYIDMLSIHQHRFKRISIGFRYNILNNIPSILTGPQTFCKSLIHSLPLRPLIRGQRISVSTSFRLFPSQRPIPFWHSRQPTVNANTSPEPDRWSTALSGDSFWHCGPFFYASYASQRLLWWQGLLCLAPPSVYCAKTNQIHSVETMLSRYKLKVQCAVSPLVLTRSMKNDPLLE